MIEFDIKVQRPTILVQGKGILSEGITALTGASGNGKSTLIKSLAGLIKPKRVSLVMMGFIGFTRSKIYL